MSVVIPHIVKQKVGHGLWYPIKYSDLESCFTSRIEESVHLDVYFQANHPYWLEKKWQRWRREDFVVVDLTYRPRDRFRRWDGLTESPDAVVVRSRVHALPHELTDKVSFTRALLGKSVSKAVTALAESGLFKRRWQVTTRLLIRDRLLDCTSLVWKHVTAVVTSKEVVELGDRNSRN